MTERLPTDESPAAAPARKTLDLATLYSVTPPPPPPASTITATPVAVPVLDALEADESLWREVLLQVPSWLVSMVLHLSLVLLMAMLAGVHHFADLGPGSDDQTQVSAISGAENIDRGDDLKSIDADLDALDAAMGPIASQLSSLPPASADFTDMAGPLGMDLPATDLTLKGLGGAGLPEAEALARGGGGGTSLELRLSGTSRAALLRSGGGTTESEQAVHRALEWLAEHQNYDGSWSFQHDQSPKCHGKCANPGIVPGHVAATAMALLPFLGTGETHREGPHKKTVDLGLRYLLRMMQIQTKDNLGSFFEPGGQMYGHGLATIVLSEIYGMTRDPTLARPAQAAVNFIVAAQDAQGGGWRYVPGQAGDTSVVGWQMMALKSAQMAYLKVPPLTLRKAGYFLDHVQAERGAVYGYQSPDGRRPATTAIGLLSRMYLGWQHDHDSLERGVAILGRMGPSTDRSNFRNNMYYNYYATQVMHHYGGYPWQRWNEVMREHLVNTQVTVGHEAGSWFLDGIDMGAMTAGRLYCTSMAAMTLEVYYRHMPLYRHQSTEDAIGRP